MDRLTIIGGGLAGSEAAWQAAEMGIPVNLFEMRPAKNTGAHTTTNLAELVCSNSFGSNLPDKASGLLKNELRQLGSLLIKMADETSLPAGSALAVDRDSFSTKITEQIEAHPLIQIIREEVQDIPPGTVIVASGPLTSEALANSIRKLTREAHLYFYDAIAPVVLGDSIDMTIAFRASRYGKGEAGEGDYINCPFTREQYETFWDELCNAEQIPLRDFEEDINHGVRSGEGVYFEGCLPIEVLAKRGTLSLAYGPLRPVGLRNPNTGERPYAVLQLRQDNLAGSLYNMVGFQTNLIYPEQNRVFRLIPGLEKAEFARLGQMHRNTFIASPRLINSTLQFRERADLFFAGQIAGVEGYIGNVATGLLAGINAARFIQGRECLSLPDTTMLGALCRYITQASMEDFQPMKANFGILPSLNSPNRLTKRERFAAIAERARTDLSAYLKNEGLQPG